MTKHSPGRPPLPPRHKRSAQGPRFTPAEIETIDAVKLPQESRADCIMEAVRLLSRFRQGDG